MAQAGHIEVREVAPGDLAALRRIFLEARRAAFTWLDTTRLKPEDFDNASAGETVLVALTEKVVSGFVAWWPPDNFVHSLFVAPGMERQGIGRALLNAALARMARPARLKVDAPNARAIAFYTSQGWRIAGGGQGENGPYHLMQLD